MHVLLTALGLVGGWVYGYGIVWWFAGRVALVAAACCALLLGVAMTVRWRNAFGVAFAAAAVATCYMGFVFTFLGDFD